MTKNARIERTATRLAGTALLLGGLACNPLGLAHFFPTHPLDIEGIIALQIALIVSGGWLIWRGPRLPLIPIVLVAFVFGALAVCRGVRHGPLAAKGAGAQPALGDY